MAYAKTVNNIELTFSTKVKNEARAGRFEASVSNFFF